MYKLPEYTVIKKYTSKKNDVYKIKINTSYYVLKCFAQNNMAKREAEHLQLLRKKKLTVPKMYYKDEKRILMELIEGPTLLDILTYLEVYGPFVMNNIKIDNDIIIDELLKWLFDFYYIYKDQGLILWDTNLRNFIYNGKLYGIDFETVAKGKSVDDIGKIIAYLLTYNPSFTEFKLDFANSMLKKLNSYYIVDNIENSVKNELKKIEKRRSVTIDTDKIYLFKKGGQN